MIKRRLVLYVHGYDPQGPTGYYRLFRRELKKFQPVWGVGSQLGELRIESETLASWNIDTSGPNWNVATHYDFLRYDDTLNENLSQPIYRQIGRALRWLIDDIISGTAVRIIRASWRFWMHLFVLQLGLLLWLAVSIAAGALAGWGLGASFATPAVVNWAIGAAVAILAILALRPVAERAFVIRINNCWPYLREFGRGQAPGFDRAIEAGAQRLVRAALSNVADEIVVFGHSGGGPISMAVVARALELDPYLARYGPPVILMTLGSIMPAVALHPKATHMRDIVARIAREPSIRWIDCQSRKDPMNFWSFDPVEDVGVQVGSERANPLIYVLRFRDMLSTDHYKRIRANFFRLHYQFIMAGERRAPYDYFFLVCGPVSVSEWAERKADVLADFSAEMAYAHAPERHAAELQPSA